MSTETPSLGTEILDLKTLSYLSKMKYVLEVFDLGNDKQKNEERKKNFIELMSRYHRAYIKSKFDISTKKSRDEYEAGRAELHNKIMDTLTNMSLSIGLTPEQKEVVSYLTRDRNEVTKMISSYFTNTDSTTINTPSEYLKIKDQLNALSGKAGPEEE